MVVIIFSFVVAEREREKKRERDAHNSSFPLFCVLLRLQKRLPHRRRVVISFPIVSTPTTPKIPPRRRPGFFFSFLFCFFFSLHIRRVWTRNAARGSQVSRNMHHIHRDDESQSQAFHTDPKSPPLYLKNKKI